MSDPLLFVDTSESNVTVTGNLHVTNHVGIGTDSPVGKLDVNGSTRSGYDTNTTSYLCRAAV